MSDKKQPIDAKITKDDKTTIVQANTQPIPENLHGVNWTQVRVEAIRNLMGR